MNSLNGTFASFPQPKQYAEGANSVRVAYGKLKDAVLDSLQHPRAVKSSLCKLLPTLFELRMRVVVSSGVSFKEQIQANDQKYAKIMRPKEDTTLESFFASIRFAMRTYDRVMQNLANSRYEPIRQKKSKEKPFVPDYEKSMAIIGFLPQGEALLQWIHSSLFIEFGIIVADSLALGHIQPPPTASIEELNILIIEAAQNFGSSARQLGFWAKKGEGNPIEWTNDISANDLDEERTLAETGFSDFAHDLQ